MKFSAPCLKYPFSDYSEVRLTSLRVSIFHILVLHVLKYWVLTESRIPLKGGRIIAFSISSHE